ncbi:MAG TPA: hypothetical protein VFO85_11860, partial [Vicinamibacteria bacterium]|nr:hypothetical protein [Vicinamibacteria bacterium]
MPLPLLLAAALQTPDETVRRQESVAVDRVVVELRVLDGRSRPVRGLQRGDFRLEVDGREFPVES